ncbi:MAG: Uma2 family endonuclease [Dehalococcoidia bacterium]
MGTPPDPELMTAEDLLRLPEDGNRYELSRGTLIVLSLASYWSSMAAAAIASKVGTFVRDHRLGVVAGADGGMLLERDPDTLRAPAVSFARRDRIPVDLKRGGFICVAPDLAIEVLSPSDRMVEVNRTIRDYFLAGTRLVWVIDPDDRSALVYHADRPVEIVGPDGTIDGENVLPGFSLLLAELWSELDDELATP